MSTWKKMSITIIRTLAVVTLVGAVGWARGNGTGNDQCSEGAARAEECSEGTRKQEAEAGELTWHTSMERAIREAGKRNAPVLVDFYADWCGWCQKMEEETFSDAEVRAQMSDFVLLKVNTDEQADLARRYEVEGLPTTVVLNSEGETVLTRPGYMSPEDYLKLLARVD